MTTRILHVSDTHLGNRQYGSDTRRDDFADAFEQAIQYAINEDVDAVIHTGDLFNSRDPRLPDLNGCIDILERLRAADIPFYGIVGNHERKMDAQYLDLIHKTNTADRLEKSPTVINDEVAVYGIDAVTNPAWHAEDFELAEPPEGSFTILCMHQLLHPPVPELFAEHPLEDVIERVNVEIDALALGDYHETEGTIEDGTKVWYAGSTERCSKGETAPRTVSLLEIEDGSLTRREKELDTRDFIHIDIPFAEDDGYGYAEDVIDRYDVGEKVVTVALTEESTNVTSRDVREIVISRGATVCRVDDQRGGPDIDLSDGPTGDIESADKLIEEKLGERNFSDISVGIEERVRLEGVTPTGFEDEVENMVMEAQEKAFGDDVAANEEVIEE